MRAKTLQIRKIELFLLKQQEGGGGEQLVLALCCCWRPLDAELTLV